MGSSGLSAEDWNKPCWGNFQSNIDFMEKTGLFNSQKNILEIGSGKGGLTRYLSQLGHDVTGIDLDFQAIKDGRKENGDLPILLASGDTLPFKDQSFDIVISFDVFEHIPDSDKHLSEVARVLKPDGYYILQTPNKWTNVLFETIRFTRKFGIRNAFRFLEDHCSLHSYWQLKRRFKNNSFDVEYFDIPVVNDFFKTKVKMFLGSFGLFILKIVNPDNFPLPLRTNFFLQAKKKTTK